MTEQFILTLIDRFESGSMRELALDDGASRFLLSKNTYTSPVKILEGSHTAPVQDSVAGRSVVADNAANASSASKKETFEKSTLSEQSDYTSIISPIVGTFYASPSADSPAFVNKGSTVKKGDTLCILEAMKMMNKLEAEFDCEILEIKAGPGDLIEFGQVLFEVKRL
ncbi:MAG: acetyl-CoA carboxylase biotin carboxyl carrier protein [Spirochaetaceae bacterium]|nr:acetyl-CoA carboxylase biotin carboxyl carrier protein [Spirochaetaceae bacterium]